MPEKNDFLFLFPAVFVVSKRRRLDFDPLPGLAGFLRLCGGFANYFRHLSQGFFLIFTSAFGRGEFGITHDVDFDFRTLAGKVKDHCNPGKMEPDITPKK